MKKFLAIALLAIGSFAQAQQDAATALQQRVTGIRAIDTDFEQVAYSGGNQNSEGNLKISKPGSFAWHYKKPTEQQIVTNGQKVYFYDKDLAQVTVYKHKDLNGDMAAVILNGGPALTNNFNISLESNVPQELAGKGLAKAEAYRLTPRNSKIEYSAIWVVFNNGKLDRLLLDGDKQKTALFFKNMKINPKLDNAVFNFRAPEGVDVIEN